MEPALPTEAGTVWSEAKEPGATAERLFAETPAKERKKRPQTLKLKPLWQVFAQARVCCPPNIRRSAGGIHSPNSSVARLRSSSGVKSSMRVAKLQRCPYGSVTMPDRSP